MVTELRQNHTEAAVVKRATAIAAENIKLHVGGLNQKYAEADRWAAGVLEEQGMLLEEQESALAHLSAIPARKNFASFFYTRSAKGVSAGGHTNSNLNTLQDYVGDLDVRTAVQRGRLHHKRLDGGMKDIKKGFDRIVKDSTQLTEHFSQAFGPPSGDAEDEADRLMEEIEVIERKISSDYETYATLPDTAKSLSTISKTALQHTRNLLPSLLKTSSEINHVLRQSVDRKNHVMAAAVEHMRNVSRIESSLRTFTPQLSNIDIGSEAGEAFNILSSLVHIPSTYGSLLIESTRRREWDEKMTSDSSTLAEEMASYKEAEEQRRRKWLKTVSEYINAEGVDTQAIGIEINVQRQERQWPLVERADIVRFVEDLGKAGGYQDVIKELNLSLKDLDVPSKQQARRLKAFKNGSMHEASFGRSFLTLRGDDETVRNLQLANSKLEERLKGSESRVRKLEDLVHRQSSIQRPPNFNAYGPNNSQSHERQATSPVLNHASFSPKVQESLSRRSSTSSRRISSSHTSDEKAMAQRIVKLEAELGNEKIQTAELKTIAANKAKDEGLLRTQLEEAVSMKKDLLDNLGAQQREFDDERHTIEEETTRHKIRLEEVEDELDRVLGSRDHEKSTIYNRIQNLEDELSTLRGDHEGELHQASSRIEALHQKLKALQDKTQELECELRDSEEAKQMSNLRIKAQEEAQAMHKQKLESAHKSLAADAEIPHNYGILVEGLNRLATKSNSQLQQLEQVLAQTRREREILEIENEQKINDFSQLTDQLAHEQRQALDLQQKVVELEETLSSLHTELGGEREAVQDLHSRHAAGETGADVLKSRLADEERKVETSTAEIAAITAHNHRLRTEVIEKASRIDSLHSLHKDLTESLAARNQRAYDVSLRLASQTRSLNGLLEYLGYIATTQDGTMMIQKVPRSTNASTTLNEISQSMNRSISGPVPTKHSFDDHERPDTLEWAKAQSPELEESKFTAFMQELSSFNVDIFGEVIVKRVKETEHTARKWQREAKAYREKSHRAQSEAHEKIAFRSFKEGDLALFLPTRNQATRPWAAFNVGAPHYFLREQDSHRLRARDWLLARISKVEERVVDLSRSINGLHPSSDRPSLGDTSDGGVSMEDENPFELSDGLRWYFLDAAEEKLGAPSTPGLGKSTVASAHVDAKGSIPIRKKSSSGNAATKTLSKSLDSRRSSTNSRKGVAGVSTPVIMTTPSAVDGQPTDIANVQEESTMDGSTNEPRDNDAVINQDVRRDLLWGP